MLLDAGGRGGGAGHKIHREGLPETDGGAVGDEGIGAAIFSGDE